MMGVGRGKQEKYGKMGRENKKKEEVKKDAGIQREGETPHKIDVTGVGEWVTNRGNVISIDM